jgi:exodeoxyribonuclease VII small subunit
MAKAPNSTKQAAELGSSPSSPTDLAQLSLESALAELDRLVKQIESGESSLEDSLAAYQRGAHLVLHCRQVLESVEQKVQMLEGDLLRPFDPDDSLR